MVQYISQSFFSHQGWLHRCVTCAVTRGFTLMALCAWFNALTLKFLIIGSFSLCFVSEFQWGTEPGAWILSTVPSLTACLPPWDGSGPPARQGPGALALLNFPPPPLLFFRPFQTHTVSRNLATCTLSEKETGGYTPAKRE